MMPLPAEQFDPFAEGQYPFRAFARARALGGALAGVPPYANLGTTVYVFTHRLVHAALTHPRLLHSTPGGVQLVQDSISPAQHLLAVLNRSLIMADPPRHGTLRRPLNPMMTGANAAALIDGIRDHAFRIITPLAAVGRFDAVQDFAMPLSVRVIEQVLGIPAPDKEMLQAATDAMLRVMDLSHNQGAEEDAYAAEKFVADILAAGEVRPDGLVATMIAQHREGLWSRDDLLASILFFLFAGHETVVDTFGNALIELDAAPVQRSLLQRRKVDWTVAADELLRMCGPVNYAGARIAAEDLEFGGITMRTGTAVVPVLSSANRDTAISPAGDELRFDMPGSPVMTFSAGIHTCIGRHVARIEIAALLEALFTAAPGWTLDRGSLVTRNALLMRGLTHAFVNSGPIPA